MYVLLPSVINFLEVLLALRDQGVDHNLPTLVDKSDSTKQLIVKLSVYRQEPSDLSVLLAWIQHLFMTYDLILIGSLDPVIFPDYP
jgi:hypothetical protein